VIGLGAGATRHQVGDRVCLEPGVPCALCRECRSGRYNLCGKVQFLGAPPVDGSMTNYLAVHEDFAFPLPPTVSDEAGALIEPLAVAVWACRKAGVSAGDRVLVTGAGPIGLLVAQTARASGAAEVVITDVSEPRLELARRLASIRRYRQGLRGGGVLERLGRSRVKTVNVRADGTGLSSRAGTALLPLVAARLGLTGGLSDALGGTRERRPDASQDASGRAATDRLRRGPIDEND
jgi:NADPH:quinone reductase-like Zn-dependent oxidoreductase